MKFKKEVLEDICFGDHDKEIYEIIVKGDWIDDGKYSFRGYIFKFNNRFYSVDFNRSGYYHSGYYYWFEGMDDEVDCIEVEPKEVKAVEWVKKEE